MAKSPEHPTSGAVFFDFEGTLNDTAQSGRLYAADLARWMGRRFPAHEADWGRAVLAGLAAMRQHQAAAADQPLPPDGYDTYRQKELSAWLEAMVEVAGLRLPADLSQAELLSALERAIVLQLAPTTGAVDAVRQLARSGMSLYISSGADSRYVERCLVDAGLRECFREVFGPDKLQTLKTSPEFFTRCFAAAEVEPAAAWVVDDSPDPLAWALDLGAQVVAVGLDDRDLARLSDRSGFHAIRNLQGLTAVLSLVK